MNRLLPTLMLVCVMLAATGCAALPATARSLHTASPTLTAAQAVQATLTSVVYVQSRESGGTGFVAYEAGQVITAFHVIGDVDAVLTVFAADGTEHRAMVLGADQARDLALLSVPSLLAPPLLLSALVTGGETVFAVGYAANFAGDPSITRGIVSANRLDAEGIGYVQTDASLNPGNSGGPLLNEQGEVVGVNVLKLRGTWAEFESLGFALSVEELRLVRPVMQSGKVSLLPSPTPALRQDLPRHQPATLLVCLRSIPTRSGVRLSKRSTSISVCRVPTRNDGMRRSRKARFLIARSGLGLGNTGTSRMPPVLCLDFRERRDR
jgi:hypothetical protein